MEIETIELRKNSLMRAYEQDSQLIHNFFDYELHERSYKERVVELQNRSFQRSAVVAAVRSFMEPFGLSAVANQHLKELEQDAVVVIGGQQAGILTGPLYAVHKAISIILLAKQKREELQIPVVPIFWVAGEDHDLLEINHVYTCHEGNILKKQFKQKFVLKQMASETVFDQKEMDLFIRGVFQQYGETAYTKELLEKVLSFTKKSKNFVQFFVYLMNDLFKEEGLLLIDAAYQPLRSVEKSYFEQLIVHAKSIAESVCQREEQLFNLGFERPIHAERDAANLFYVHHEKGRLLLSRNDDLGTFEHRASGFTLTKEELLDTATTRPHLLSNNVVTRPLMQEFLFPVLAFVGGPGEISYWALLKDAFHMFNMKLPIVVPRLSITIVSRAVQQSLKATALSIKEVFEGEVSIAYEQAVKNLRNELFMQQLQRTVQLLETQYDKLTSLVDTQDHRMETMIQKNLVYHKRQIDYLANKMEKTIVDKNKRVLRHYHILQSELIPNGSLQERFYTPYQYMTQYGSTLIQDLLHQPFRFDGTHQLVYL